MNARASVREPGPGQGDREQHGGQQHQEDRDAVDPDVPRDADGRGPHVARHELVAAVAGPHGDGERRWRSRG